MRSIALVLRKSKKDEQQVSLGRQERLGRDWATTFDPTAPVEVYSDNGVSGADMDRDDWVRFVTDVRAGRVAAVWAYEQSRLTRAGLQTWDEVVVMLDRAGLTELHTHRQGQISVREGSRLQGRLLALLDQEEREIAKVRMLDAQRDLARQGRPGGGTTYGYRRVLDEEGRKALEIDEDQAVIVKEMAARILDGEPLMHIAEDLNARSVPTARGGVWTNTQIRNITTKPTVAGLRGHHGEVYEARWPAILDRDTWDQVRLSMTEVRTVVGRDGRMWRIGRHQHRGRRYLLTGGVAVCGLCGTPLVAQVRAIRKSPGKSPAYSCQRGAAGVRAGACGGVSIMADRLEQYVVGRMLTELSEKGVGGLLRDDTSDRVELLTKVADAERRRRQLVEDYAAGLLPDATYSDGLKIAARKVDDARAALAGLGAGELAELDDPALLAQRWHQLTLSRQRQIIATVVGNVTIVRAQPGTRKFDPDRIRLGRRPDDSSEGLAS